MEIHVQQCQKCLSSNMKNIICRESGEPDRVYVQCHDCQDFVASYVMAPLGYFHNGKGYESFLRGVQRSGEFISGRSVKELFFARKNNELAAFNEVVENLRKKDEKKSN
jgi:hypothetical protein